ncbi:lethal(2) giant larvae protein homolog 2-like [Carassius auratus]|uniref:LLGL scribble cell polarity complex component 2 n=1 Tax=Carassius auratus TaxID=7957 RepID=A0A6P6L382_CARAU|nr:lethal(2) giant larvae protein homolog 2-like [Carassius auratus]
MKRFRRHGHESQKDKHKQDLYQFNKTVEHGFPHQPSALGFSPSLDLLAIGTRSGAIKLYGSPGVEFMGLHDENAAVTQVHFLPNQVEMVTLLDDNSLHMWTLQAHNGMSELLEIGRFTLSGPPGAPPSVNAGHCRPGTLIGRAAAAGHGGRTCVCCGSARLSESWRRTTSAWRMYRTEFQRIMLAAEIWSVWRLCMKNPLNPRQVLIGYSRGLMVLWDLDRQRPIQHFLGTQQLESVWWMEDGVNILSSHSDGSYCQWDSDRRGSTKQSLRNRRRRMVRPLYRNDLCSKTYKRI